MAADLKLKSGTDYLPRYNWEIGMNDDVAYSDRAGWTTSVEMLTGGRPENWEAFGGLEVGNQYDLDPMGEQRTMSTFSNDAEGPAVSGHIGLMAAEGFTPMQPTQKTVGSKNVDLMEPQTYNDVGRIKKG